MEPQVKTFIYLTDLEYWKDAPADFQSKISRRLELMITTALHLTKIVK